MTVQIGGLPMCPLSVIWVLAFYRWSLRHASCVASVTVSWGSRVPPNPALQRTRMKPRAAELQRWALSASDA